MKPDTDGSDLPTSVDRAIKVSDVNEEYEFMRRAACSCGVQGKFELDVQSLASGPKGPMDLMEVHCSACGRRFEFYFDVSGLPYFQ